MSNDDTQRRPKMEAEHSHAAPHLRRVQKVCLLIALGMMLVGGGLWAMGSASSQDLEPVVVPAKPSLAIGLDADPKIQAAETDASTEADEPGTSAISPAVFRVGFSFAVAFAVAYAARVFLRLSIIALGLFLLAIFSLEYAGLVTVNWDQMKTHFDTFAFSAAESFDGFREFITGRLPSAGSAMAGLVIGFRKK